MVFKFSKNTIYKGKLYKKDKEFEIDTHEAHSLAERGFGTIINENVDDTAAPGEDETNVDDTAAPGEDETNVDDTAALGEDETNVDDKKSVSQSTAKKKGK